MKVKAIKVNRAHYFLTDPRILLIASTINATLNKSDIFDERTYKWLIDFLLTVAIHEIPLADVLVTYYVSGYITCSIARLQKCSSCTKLLISSNNIPTDVDECIPSKYQVIYKMANRGGLSIPTEFCFLVVLLGVQYFTAIGANEEKIQKLMCSNNQRSIFLCRHCRRLKGIHSRPDTNRTGAKGLSFY